MWYDGTISPASHKERRLAPGAAVLAGGGPRGFGAALSPGRRCFLGERHLPFPQKNNAVTFTLLYSVKVPAARAARLARQGFAGHSISFEAGFAPSSSPTAPHSFSHLGTILWRTKTARQMPGCFSVAKSLAEFRRPQATEENQIVFPAACTSEKYSARSERRIVCHMGPPPEPSEAGPVGRGGAVERAPPAACGGRRDAELVPTTRRAQRIPFGGKGVSLFRQSQQPGKCLAVSVCQKASHGGKGVSLFRRFHIPSSRQ